MRTKEQTQEIARLANTTPEIVEAVLSAQFKVRYVFIEPMSKPKKYEGSKNKETLVRFDK